MSKDMLFGVTLAASAATVGAGAMYIANDLLKKGRDKHKGDFDSCLARCTCTHEDEHTTCERHDQELLYEISKLISRPNLMWEVGINLAMKAHIIEAIHEDNKGSINTAAFVMLRRWYTDHKKLKVAELKHAMSKANLGKYNEEIIDKHFVNRRQGYLDT